MITTKIKFLLLGCFIALSIFLFFILKQECDCKVKISANDFQNGNVVAIDEIRLDTFTCFTTEQKAQLYSFMGCLKEEIVQHRWACVIAKCYPSHFESQVAKGSQSRSLYIQELLSLNDARNHFTSEQQIDDIVSMKYRSLPRYGYITGVITLSDDSMYEFRLHWIFDNAGEIKLTGAYG